MKMTLTFWGLLTVLTLTLFACKKEEEEVIEDPCLNYSAYTLNATIGGDKWCANASLFADYAIVMTISGINDNGSTLLLELDDVDPGTYSITGDSNYVLYTSTLADGFQSTNDNPGTLTIVSHDLSTDRIRGTFSVTVLSPLTGNKSIAGGSFNVVYPE